MLHRQQSADFGGVEPQAWQFVARRILRFARQPIAARFAIPFDRRVQPIAHVFEVALECRARYTERVEKLAELHCTACGEQLVDLVEAFGAVHARRRVLTSSKLAMPGWIGRDARDRPLQPVAQHGHAAPKKRTIIGSFRDRSDAIYWSGRAVVTLPGLTAPARRRSTTPVPPAATLGSFGAWAHTSNTSSGSSH